MARSHHCSRPAALSVTAVWGAAPQRSHAASPGPPTAQLATYGRPSVRAAGIRRTLAGAT